jgi:RNA polymerase-interacting CarD/CdnL/TRCF family regulator
MTAGGDDLRLEIGDQVVYGSHGVGTVTKRQRDSVVVEFDGLSVTLPLEQARTAMRPVAGEAELAAVKRALKSPASDTQTWQARQKSTQGKVVAGEIVGLAEIVRDYNVRLVNRNGSPGSLSWTDRKAYRKARELLAAEIAAYHGTAPADADGWITAQLHWTTPAPTETP